MLTKIQYDWIDLEKISWIRTSDIDDCFATVTYHSQLNLIVDGNRIDIGFIINEEFIQAKKIISLKLDIKL